MIFSSTDVANPPAGDRTRRYNSFASKAAGTGTAEFAVASTVSYASPGDGYATFRGVAPDCNWAGLKVFPDNGSSGSSLDVVEALDDIVAQKATYGIKVANMSLGIVGDPGIDLTVRNKVNTAAMNGIVMVVSAGNDGTKGVGAIAEIDDPGRAHYAITVAAAADDNQLTDYSSQGVLASGAEVTGDNDMKPDILAPGGSSYESNIMSIDSNNGDSEDTSGANFPDTVPDNYLNIKGTSMASPYLAGCAALVIDALQQAGQTWNYTLADVLNVKKILLMTATETNQIREATPSQDPTLDRGGKDISEGYGMVNADAAVQAVLSPAYVLGTTVTQSFGANPVDGRCWASPFQIYSATPIDLKLTAPAGATFDIYVYSATPDLHGNPMLIQSATGVDGNKSLTFAPASDEDAYLVVKRISGAGAWTLGESFELDVNDWRMY
jgi:serine protease AprX